MHKYIQLLMKQKETQSFDAFHKKLFRNELKPAEKWKNDEYHNKWRDVSCILNYHVCVELSHMRNELSQINEELS